MKVVRVTAHGGPEVLKMAESSLSKPGRARRTTGKVLLLPKLRKFGGSLIHPLKLLLVLCRWSSEAASATGARHYCGGAHSLGIS